MPYHAVTISDLAHSPSSGSGSPSSTSSMPVCDQEVFRSMKVERSSKTPYSDATQVRTKCNVRCYIDEQTNLATFALLPRSFFLAGEGVGLEVSLNAFKCHPICTAKLCFLSIFSLRCCYPRGLFFKFVLRITKCAERTVKTA